MEMTSRERVKRALTFGRPDRVPRNLWALPGVWMFRKEEMEEFNRAWPSDIAGPAITFGRTGREKGDPCHKGVYTDAWGCTWHVGEDGVVGEVKEPPLADWSAMKTYKLPWEILRNADLSQVNRSCAETDKFILLGGETRPFERLQFLLGSEKLFVELGYATAEVRNLLAMLHEFFMEEMKTFAATDVDGVSFMDDWGSQRALLISPDMWRELFKPLYADYCSILKRAGKFVFFHSDGHIASIYPDLIEIGVNAVNSQLFCMDIEDLARLYKGRITFWGEIDRQRILPFGTTEEVRQAVRRVHKALWDPAGGVIAQCEWGVKDPRENIEAVFDEWERLTRGS